MARLSVFLCLAFFVLAASAQKAPKKAKKDDGKIVGGESTTIENHPYQVSIQDSNGKHFCGGSIITPKHVLTAAHCLAGMSRMQIVAGVTKLSDKTRDNVHTVRKATVHPNYNTRNQDNDIGVIELNTPFKFSNKVRIAALDHNEFSPDSKLLVSGWGLTSANGRASNHLLKVDVNGINRETCQKRYTKFGSGSITNNMICAGFDGVGGKDACQGDSGGPAMSRGTGKQVGVVSWGRGCAEKDFPGVYTNVANYIPWLRTVTGYRV